MLTGRELRSIRRPSPGNPQTSAGYPNTPALENSSAVLPGQVVTSDTQYMRGHGTFSLGDSLVASVAGYVHRVNKLVSVSPARSRFNGEIGDVVVGRITSVGQKRWKVDINARQDAVLLLSSVNLPGGVQRRKTEMDELGMREFFDEGHLFSAEVQSFFQDGAASLHTRSLKYGILRNGNLVVVPSSLVKRSKSHFVTLTCGVDVIIGLNGWIWVAPAGSHSSSALDDPSAFNAPLAKKQESEGAAGEHEISRATRDVIARVCNCITLLARTENVICEDTIGIAMDLCASFANAPDVLKAESCANLGDFVRQRYAEMVEG
ncbi:MAG: hypothetical protein SGCHY_000333 [Lobulomycetales sp.]